MKTIVYRKSDLLCVGVLQEDTTFEWEVENNVIPNHDGTVDDYAAIETDLKRFHLENINGVVTVIEDGLTIEEQNKITIQSIQQYDNPRDAETIFEILKAKGILTDEDLPQSIKERFDSKNALRQQLQSEV